MKEDTIKIAGGGISGLSCAIMLAKSGFSVRVYEKKPASGGRFYGDWQGLENWTKKTDVLQELNELELDISFKFKPLPSLELINGNGLTINFGQPSRPLCYLVKRGISEDSLDQALYRSAQKAGVQFNFNRKLKADEADVIATGPRTKEVFAVDTGIQFRTTHEDTAVAIVNNDAAFKGYAYLLIADGYGCICTVMFDKFNQIHQHFKRTMEIVKKHVSIEMSDPVQVGGIGSFSNELCFKKNGSYIVGEAAGLQDLLWGFGIRSAISSGMLAAKCIKDGVNYESTAKEMFSNRLNSSIVIRYLFEKFGRFPKGYEMMGRLIKHQTDPSNFLHKAYGYTPIHQIVMPWAKRSMRKRYPALYI